MTDIETARLSLSETIESFDATVAKAEKTAKPEPLAKTFSDRDIDMSLFGKFVNTMTPFAWRSTISKNEAWKGLVAGRKIIVGLAKLTNDYVEINAFNQLLVIIRDELTKMVDDDWQSRSVAYTPYTKALTKAAGRLEATRKRAVELANSLNLAADVLGAFSKLLGAF